MDKNGGLSHGAAVKRPGVYILINNKEEPTIIYIGQSIAVGHRVANHMGKSSDSITKDMITSLKEQNHGFVKTFLITDDIFEDFHITEKEFLDILEQYIILKYKPNLNQIFLVRRKGNLNHLSRPYHPDTSPLYVYKTEKPKDLSNITLIYIYPSISSLGVDLDLPILKKRDFGHNVLKQGGFYRNLYYFSKGPLETPTQIDFHSKESFLELMSKAYKIPRTASGKKFILINSTTNEKLGPFGSPTYVCKNILKGGANRRSFMRSLEKGQQYKGYILQLVDEDKDELLNLFTITISTLPPYLYLFLYLPIPIPIPIPITIQLVCRLFGILVV